MQGDGLRTTNTGGFGFGFNIKALAGKFRTDAQRSKYGVKVKRDGGWRYWLPELWAKETNANKKAR